MTMGTEPMSADPLTALTNEYGAEWKVWRPGLYVAAHHRLDVTLISDSVPELAEKLRAPTGRDDGPHPAQRIVGSGYRIHEGRTQVASQ